MHPVEWAIALAAAVCATLFATADSALLAFHASESSTASEHAFAERERLHRALSMGRVLAYIAAGASVAQALSLPMRTAGERLGVIAIAAIVLCIIAEGVGRAIGYATPGATYAKLLPMTHAVGMILSPAVGLGAAIDRTIHMVIPPTPSNASDRETSAEQFREVVAAEADVSLAEEQLIHGVFSLGETEVQEIMVPRVDIVGVDSETPWSEVLDRVRSSEHARFPVYRETLDDVTGILYAKDLLPAVIAGDEPVQGWMSLVRPASFIPISKRIDDQLRDFQSSHAHIAIVSDEYGGTAGLVTIEDILEEIVGEIRDEYDVEQPEIEQNGAARYWVAGRVPLDELSDRLGTDFSVGAAIGRTDGALGLSDRCGAGAPSAHRTGVF
jgi:putative hemolysin